MTGPRHSVDGWMAIHCNACGKVMGSSDKVVLGLICDDPFCLYQGAPDEANQRRDAGIAFAATEGVPLSQIAFACGLSRQRIYQILNEWRKR